jgi:hypothetical protein
LPTLARCPQERLRILLRSRFFQISDLVDLHLLSEVSPRFRLPLFQFLDGLGQKGPLRILLDENLPWTLGTLLTGHEYNTVGRMGWGGIKNGKLLTLARKHFDIFLSVDRGLPFEQNLPKFNIAVFFAPRAQQLIAGLATAGVSNFNRRATAQEARADHY